MSYEVPLVEKDGEEWVLLVPRAPVIRTKDRALADSIWRAATWAHNNGAENAREKMRVALGVNP